MPEINDEMRSGKAQAIALYEVVGRVARSVRHAVRGRLRIEPLSTVGTPVLVRNVLRAAERGHADAIVFHSILYVACEMLRTNVRKKGRTPEVLGKEQRDVGILAVAVSPLLRA
jgi:hypothetical protein